MLVDILMAVIFRRLGWQGMHIEFGGGSILDNSHL